MVERISTELSLDQFQERYLRLNKPCVFSGTFTKGWRSRIEWVKDGKPNAKYLSDKFGNFDFSKQLFCLFLILVS